MMRDSPYREVGGRLAPCIQLCGRFVVRLGGARVDAALPGRQGRLALAHLVLHRRRPVSRDELAEALWFDGPPADPAGALAALLSKLRRAVGGDVLAGRSLIELHLPPGTLVDVEAALEAIHRAETAVQRGDFAAGWAPARVALHTAGRRLLPGDEAPWLDAPRAELDEVLLRAHETVAAIGIGLGGAELDASLRSGRALMRLAPLRESGARLLMEALAARGDHAEALATYDRLRITLRDELGAGPGPVTEALHRELLGQT